MPPISKKYILLALAIIAVLVIGFFVYQFATRTGSERSSRTGDTNSRTDLTGGSDTILTPSMDTSGGVTINIITAGETPIAKDLFGVALNNIGKDFNDFSANPLWNTMIQEVGFTSGAYTAGAEDRWIHPIALSGWPAKATGAPVVGMGANLDEIFHYTNSTSGAYNLQKKINDTGVDFWDATAKYVENHDQTFVFTANIIHGTPEEMGVFIDSIKSHGIGSYKLRFGQEVSTGIGGALTSDQYIAKLDEFYAYLKSHYSPLPPMVVNMADHSTPSWNNADVYAWARDHGVAEFSQYAWLDGRSSKTSIDEYFAEIRPQLSASLRDTLLPRLSTYAKEMPSIKMHLGQYGLSLQRGGYGAHTMLHGVMIWNFLFEILKFNSTHNNFVNSAIFLVNENAVSPYEQADGLFEIDPSFIGTDGSRSFVKRVPGVAYEMLKPVFASANPLFIKTQLGSTIDGLDAITVTSDTMRLYIYNNGPERAIKSVSVNGELQSGAKNSTSLWSEKPYGSIGSSPAYSHFKTTQGAIAPVSAKLEKGTVLLENGMTLKPYSITVIDLD